MNTDIYLFRHGQPKLQKALLGSTDSPLTQTGWRELQNTFDKLDSFDYLTSSPLIRCVDFAKQYAQKNNINPHFQIVNNWQECHFGDWDGKTYEDLHAQQPRAMKMFFDDPGNNTPPNGEPLSDFSTRIELALHQLLEQCQGKRIAVLTHAGVIRTLVAWCLNIDYQSGIQFKHFAIDYASVTHISIYQENGHPPFPQLKFLNKQAELFDSRVSKNG